jgi:hypothetical protein
MKSVKYTSINYGYPPACLESDRHVWLDIEHDSIPSDLRIDTIVHINSQKLKSMNYPLDFVVMDIVGKRLVLSEPDEKRKKYNYTEGNSTRKYNLVSPNCSSSLDWGFKECGTLTYEPTHYNPSKNVVCVPTIMPSNYCPTNTKFEERGNGRCDGYRISKMKN